MLCDWLLQLLGTRSIESCNAVSGFKSELWFPHLDPLTLYYINCSFVFVSSHCKGVILLSQTQKMVITSENASTYLFYLSELTLRELDQF